MMSVYLESRPECLLEVEARKPVDMRLDSVESLFGEWFGTIGWLDMAILKFSS